MNGYLRIRLIRLAKKVRSTVEESELFRGKLVKTMGKEASIERLLGLHLRMKERSLYTKIEEVRMKASQCEEGCFKAVEGNAKEYQIRGIELAVVVLN
ncbi:hypothetical protein Tco_1282759 [Tanacetum coccineum]